MMPSVLPWQSCLRGSRPIPHLTHRGGLQVQSRSSGWPQCAPGSSDEPLPERRATMFHVISSHFVSPGHFTRGCPHHEAFRRWHQDQANSKGAGESSPPALGSASSRPEVNVRVIGWIRNPQLEAGGPTSHWIRPETLVELTVEGRNFYTLANSGSQVNTITPALVQQYGFPVLPLEDLVDYPLNLVGLGGKRTSPLGFVIFHMQVRGIAGYDEDTVFLVVPDESNFGWRVPLVVGTCTIGRIINVI